MNTSPRASSPRLHIFTTRLRRASTALATALALAFGALPALEAFPNLDKLGDSLKKVQDTAGKAGRVVKGATGLSLEEEVAIGDAVALEIVSRYGGLSRDEALTTRVNLVGRSLARYALRQDLQWRFAVLDSSEVNAFSAPGGRVFITRGLLELAPDDDRLAGILAHEIAHIDERHALRIIARGELFGGVSALVADNNADFAQYEQVVSDITSELLDKGFDPGTEYAADKLGRELAKTTGFAPGGLRAVLTDLKASAAGKHEKTFSTHPPLDDRLQRLPKDPAPTG
ncbi:M48 family metalloprotease [Opitutales bacterium ASA1]|uniref:M48 family metalloprotease n=1 Tax=Congregicoccus parvus TaxID=3081749 RepID=UPI002B2EE7DE|nr:M48 family metalloprotease [Opitutales bacterium ASA1]